MLISVGDKVNTEHGQGTVLGFEQFGPKGFTATPSLKPHYYNRNNDTLLYNMPRVIIKLAYGHTWCFDGLYCAYPREILKLN